jgi:hypothetical protein
MNLNSGIMISVGAGSENLECSLGRNSRGFAAPRREPGLPNPLMMPIPFVKTRVSHSLDAPQGNRTHHAGTGSGGDRRSAIIRRMSANSILGTATSAIWKAT